MCRCDPFRSNLFRDLYERITPQVTGRLLNGGTRPARVTFAGRTDIHATRMTREPKHRRLSFDTLLIAFGGFATQPVIQVYDIQNQLELVCHLGQSVQQHTRIDAS
jgi:hypothetical protein